MKWQGRRKSDNVSKSRGSGSRRGMALGGGLGGGGILILLVVSLLLGQNPLRLIGMLPSETAPTQEQTETYTPRNAEEKELEDFLSVVLADTEDVWHEVFSSYGKEYREPQLRLYQNSVNSGCGLASNNMGPFYCGADETVYIDVSFAKDLRSTFGADGDFPFAYVLAHEVGHHVQNLIGTLDKVHSLRGRVSDVEYNDNMVKLELQADYYAGVFAHYVKEKGYLDAGDIEEGMQAASGVGDDRIQEMQGRKADPDTFQHGSSEQRKNWFKRGVEYGDLEHGNTFEMVR